MEQLVEALYGVAVPGALEYVIDAASSKGLGPSLAGKSTIDGKATAYVCLGSQCSAPVTEAAVLTRLLHERGCES